MKKIKFSKLINIFFISNMFLFVHTPAVFSQENEQAADSALIENSDENPDKETFEEVSQPSEKSESDSSFGKKNGFSAAIMTFQLPFVPYHENDGKKHYLSAITGMLTANLIISSWNRFVIGSSWAQTGYEEWNKFWWRRLSWDNDWYWTNFVLHPYQGSLYYMSSRNSNLNPLESMAVTVLGSAVWEYLCETNSPSKNDMIYTTVGSFAVGEMLYRLSLCTDEKCSLLSYILNVPRLVTEPMTRQKPTGPRGSIYDFSILTAGGTTTAYTNLIDCTDYSWKKFELYPVFGAPEIHIVYNDPFTNDSNSPYSHFDLRIRGAIGAGSGQGADCERKELDKQIMYNLRIESDGYVWSRSPKSSDNVDTSMGIVLIYDFDWHSFYELSSLAPGVGIKQRIKFENSRIEWQVQEAGILLGTTDFYYFHRQIVDPIKTVSRNYSYTIGAQANTKFKFIMDNGFSLNFGFRGYAMYDFYNQIQFRASVGWEFIGIGNLGIEFPISEHLRFGVADEAYAKRTYYRYYDDVFQFVNTGRMYIKWQIK